MRNEDSPPRLTLRFLERLGGGRGEDFGTAGDFEEYYRALAAEQGVRKARRECRRQVRAAIPGYLRNTIVGSATMLKYFFRIAFRNLWKHKGYSFINIAGLAAGLACALFILLWIQDELSFDRFHANAGTLYRLEQESAAAKGRFRHSSMPYSLGPILKADIPEIRDAVRLADQDGFFVRYGEKYFHEDKVRAVDPQFLGMFTFPLLKGDPGTALSRPGSIVFTEDAAGKYFGEADPMGKAVILNEAHPFTVTGILKKIPSNSSLSFDMLVPFDFIKTIGRYNDSLVNNNIPTYVRLHPGSDPAVVGGKITRLVGKRTLTSIRADREMSSYFDSHPEIRRQFESRTFLLTPLVDIHLYGTIRSVYTYGALAVFVLLIACINFMNLTTARSAGRAKEIGLRKVVGAQRKILIGQFFSESILTAFLAGASALLLVLLLFPAFNALSGKSIALSALISGKFILGMLAVTLLTGIVAGSYPALFLSAFRPVLVLNGRLRSGAKSALFRKILVFLQFGLSILLLIGMGVVSRQVDFMQNKNPGYDKEQLIYLPMRGETASAYAVFKERLLRNPRIQGVTAARHPPTAIYASSDVADWDGRDPDLRFRISFASVDFDFPETMKIEMAAGRSFSQAFATDVGKAFMVNEDVPKLMGLDPGSAVGKRFVFRGYEGMIVGVMKNFHFKSVREEIEPLAVVVDPRDFRYSIVRLAADQIPASLEEVKAAWSRTFPHNPIDYRFFDEDFDLMYREDRRTGAILKAFSAMAVLIACLGLFGLASYTAEQRTKEIGIRKVLGASSRGIAFLLSREFAACVLAANALSWPLAYFLMQNWLKKFAYRTGLAWWLFIAAGTAALVIAVLTVSFQAVRASRTNPAKALKYE